MKFWTSYEYMRGLRVFKRQAFRKSLYISPSGKKNKRKNEKKLNEDNIIDWVSLCTGKPRCARLLAFYFLNTNVSNEIKSKRKGGGMN